MDQETAFLSALQGAALIDYQGVNRPSDGSLRQHQGRSDEAGSGSRGVGEPVGERVRRSESEPQRDRERVGLGEPVTVRDGISDSRARHRPRLRLRPRHRLPPRQRPPAATATAAPTATAKPSASTAPSTAPSGSAAPIPPTASCQLAGKTATVAKIAYPGNWFTVTSPAAVACQYFDPKPITVPADPTTLKTAVMARNIPTSYADAVAAATNTANWNVAQKTEFDRRVGRGDLRRRRRDQRRGRDPRRNRSLQLPRQCRCSGDRRHLHERATDRRDIPVERGCCRPDDGGIDLHPVLNLASTSRFDGPGIPHGDSRPVALSTARGLPSVGPDDGRDVDRLRHALDGHRPRVPSRDIARLGDRRRRDDDLVTTRKRRDARGHVDTLAAEVVATLDSRRRCADRCGPAARTRSSRGVRAARAGSPPHSRRRSGADSKTTKNPSPVELTTFPPPPTTQSVGSGRRADAARASQSRSPIASAKTCRADDVGEHERPARAHRARPSVLDIAEHSLGGFDIDPGAEASELVERRVQFAISDLVVVESAIRAREHGSCPRDLVRRTDVSPSADRGAQLTGRAHGVTLGYEDATKGGEPA